MVELRREPELETGSAAALRIQTLGGFRVWRAGVEIDATAWQREKALHLWQFLITMRRRSFHKEQIVDQLWPNIDPAAGDRDFKVALSAIHRALEPERAPRAEPRFVRRHGLAYELRLDQAWVDADAFESRVAAGNRAASRDAQAAIDHYRQAVELYAGDYLPERRYEDWTSAERERLQTLALSTMTTLADLLLARSPLESLRLCQRVLSIDAVWEDAYRVQMRAYQTQGNRPMALRTYQQCVEALRREFNVAPLPETRAVYEEIKRET